MKVRKFTGWHMTGILVAFFGVVVSVNVFMARAAISTFGGTVVENSYVASQQYNRWIDKAEAQKSLGWTVDAAVGRNRLVTVDVAAAGAKAMHGVTVDAVIRHPLGRVPETAMLFGQADATHWTSTQPLPPGRWIVHLRVRRGGDEYRKIEELL